jgi:hypothetical protein
MKEKELVNPDFDSKKDKGKWIIDAKPKCYHCNCKDPTKRVKGA